MEVDMQLLAPLIGIQLLLMVIALIDLVRRDAGRVAGGKNGRGRSASSLSIRWGLLCISLSAEKTSPRNEERVDLLCE